MNVESRGVDSRNDKQWMTFLWKSGGGTSSDKIAYIVSEKAAYK